MATFQDVLIKALQAGQMKMISVNQGMIQLSRKTAKKSGFVKTAITDELVDGLMMQNRVAFILHMDAEELNALNLSIDSPQADAIKRIQNIEQAIREFHFSNGSTAQQLVDWLESTTHFILEEEHTDHDQNKQA